MSGLSRNRSRSYHHGSNHRLAPKLGWFQQDPCQAASAGFDRYTEASEGLKADWYSLDSDSEMDLSDSAAEVSSDTKKQREEDHKRVIEEALQAYGVPKPTLKYYSNLSSADHRDPTSLPTLPSAKVVINMSAEDLPRFSGEVCNYRDFRTNFLNMISHFPEGFRLYWLKRCLDPESKELIAECRGGGSLVFSKAFEILDKQYRQPFLEKTMLLHKIEDLAVIQCTHDDKAFSTIVRSMKRFYDRLLAVAPACIMSLESTKVAWLNNMPAELETRLSHLSFTEPEGFTFPRVLEAAEKYAGWKHYESLLSRDRLHQEEALHKQTQTAEITASSKDPSTRLGTEKDAPATDSVVNQKLPPEEPLDSAVLTSQWMPESGERHLQPGFSSPQLKRSKHVIHKCYICKTGQKGDHFTIECNQVIPDEQLKRLVKEEKLCLMCGKHNHWARDCRFRRDETALCKNPQCSSEPHTVTGRFCVLCKPKQ